MVSTKARNQRKFGAQIRIYAADIGSAWLNIQPLPERRCHTASTASAAPEAYGVHTICLRNIYASDSLCLS